MSSFTWMITNAALVALSEDDAKALGEEIRSNLETVHEGIEAIGVMLSSINIDDMGSRHVGPAALLIEFLGKLAWDLANNEFGTRPEYRVAFWKPA